MPQPKIQEKRLGAARFVGGTSGEDRKVPGLRAGPGLGSEGLLGRKLRVRER
jgi:hypothetical protein